MKKLFIVLILVTAPALATARGKQQQIQQITPEAGRIDRNGAQPSIPPPPGWKACPRCQNQRDRAESNAKDKAENHSFNPKDLTGIWGFNGLGNPGAPPPLTEWGQKQHEATMVDKNE